MVFEEISEFHILREKLKSDRDNFTNDDFERLSVLGKKYNQVDWCGEWLKLMDRIQRSVRRELTEREMI